MARLFPPPRYLTMPAVGVDISDYAIKFIKLERAHGGVRLVSHGKVDLPVDVINRGEIVDMATIVKLLTRIREEHGFSYAHLALPEEHAYLFQMELPVGSREELEQMVEFHLKENVPIGAAEAVFDYNVIATHQGKHTCNVSVYPAAIASQYVNALHEAGYTPLSVEIEGLATARALVDEDVSSPTLVIDIGRNDASLSISTSGTVTFTASLETGGDDLTRAIARGLDISFQEAEKLKRDHGFADTPESKHVYDAMQPVVAQIAEAIKKHLMYWQMHMSTGESGAGEVSRVILAGGNANIVGMAEYLEALLSVPVEVGNVWHNVFDFEQYIPDIESAESLEYATSVGLALRSLTRSM